VDSRPDRSKSGAGSAEIRRRKSVRRSAGLAGQAEQALADRVALDLDRTLRPGETDLLFGDRTQPSLLTDGPLHKEVGDPVAECGGLSFRQQGSPTGQRVLDGRLHGIEHVVDGVAFFPVSCWIGEVDEGRKIAMGTLMESSQVNSLRRY